MVCIWKTVLPLILILRFSFAKTIAQNERVVHNKLINIKNLPETKHDGADIKEFTRNIFNDFWNIIYKAYHDGEIDIQYFRSIAISFILLIKSESADIVESIKSAYQLINESNCEESKLLSNITRPYNDVCKAVEALVNMSTAELQNCCNITIKPLIFLCRNIRSLLISGAGYIADIVQKLNQIQLCFENSIMSPEETMQCLNSTIDELINLIQSLNQVISTFDKLMRVKILYSKCCISLVIVDVQN